MLAGRTVFVIAHRLSTVEHAQQILVLDRGRIVERGTHDALVAQRGAYHRLYTMQFRERDLTADVVSLNEVERYTGWGNEDQPARFRDLLQSATGQPWYYHFAQEYGNWDANGKGNLLLSRYPFVATGRETLSWSRTMGIATIVVNGRNINVMSTHLDPESRSRREEQARQVVSIASSWSHPRIITGDFNAWPDQSSDIAAGA